MPDDTRELITAAEFSRWLLLAACGVLVIAISAGAIWGARRKAIRGGLIRGTAAGLTGPAALLLWRIYNNIEDRYGLDSVRALLTNLGLFVVVGIVAGLLLREIWRRTEASDTSAEAQSDAVMALEETGGG